MSFSNYSASAYDPGTDSRPDKALVVKCTYDEAVKRISYSSTRACTFESLRRKIEECFALAAIQFDVAYTDDDGEVTVIASDADLTEAIRYVYPVHDDPPVSSSASIFSGRSIGRDRVTLKVQICVGYDGPSLSDTSSFVSSDGYKSRNGSEISLSFSAPPPEEFDDDSVTVSSKDTGTKHDLYRAKGPKTIPNASREPLLSKSPPASIRETEWEVGTLSSVPPTFASDILAGSSHPHEESVAVQDDPFADYQSVGDPSAVFERLKLEEDLLSKQAASSHGSSTLHSERGAAWLRDQSARTLKSMLPAPSEKSYEPSVDRQSDGESVLSGELALLQDSTGKYYYAYTGGGSSYGASQTHDSSYEDVDASTSDVFRASISANPAHSRPTSMEAYGQGYQIVYGASGSDLQRSTSRVSNPFTSPADPELGLEIDGTFPPDYIDPSIPPDVLQYINMPVAPPRDPPTCSNCSNVLDTIRYVCSSCGERKPIPIADGMSAAGKGKDRAIDIAPGKGAHPYPPTSRSHTVSSSPSMSSWSMISDIPPPHRSMSDTTLNGGGKRGKPLPALPSSGTSSSLATLTVPGARGGFTGYELCWQCLSTAGVTHALEMSVAQVSPPAWHASAEDAQRAMSQWRRAAPSQKGQLRHAYVEKSWGHNGWQDVEQDDHRSLPCSTCGTLIVNHRYKCASCENFTLCKACYSQVHEIHPSHAFLLVPDKLSRSRSEIARGIRKLMPPEDEHSLKHPGVKCMHCMQDIVGARFHCAICDSIDICANCESAGLPGNLDASDGGHSSSHIMIKIPYPLGTAELQSASQRAKNLWGGRDAATGQKVRSRRNSQITAYERTVIGVGLRSDAASDAASVVAETDDHGVRCSNCSEPIVGLRYQCATCISIPKPYSLCATCEERSYMIHDPMHVFIQFPRPLDRPLQVEVPLVPQVYKTPAGPPAGQYDPGNPKKYLKSLKHSYLLCDCCMNYIHGEWFRCAYCSKDLCEVCHRVDTHNSDHVFVIFKSLVDMPVFRQFFSIDRSQAIIPYPVYSSM
ncbi:hypothetical protein WOLCODRAFT_108609 [Wolfiporia cocos MD-104 SS10]|uniref:ZZ-type domain-containing protein n=1 Tax=Wolfiporia cocos (strain MD-104) TaxID=742152 RepID=A0A2H3JK36_WOLCO|nr:hypothetical protein WOLCODRAFT_108609 [Wolfiporia cocos MD-104 SS10]